MLRAQRGEGSFFLWQCECGEKCDGEREYEDHQIHKCAKKELKNTEEPTLSVNVTDRQENLRHKCNPEKRDYPAGDCARCDTIKPDRRKYDQHDRSVEEAVDMQRIDQMVDVKDATADVEQFQDKSEEGDAAEHHVGQVAEQRRNKESHFRAVFAHLFLCSRFDPPLEGRCGFGIIESDEWSLP